MEARLQRRIQRYGWDLAAAAYEPLWQGPLAPAHTALLAAAALAPGERVLDVACGTGLVTLRAARAVGPAGLAVGIDLASRMVETAALRARARQVANAEFARMDAEQLGLPDATFDVALCALGLMYVPQPEQALREMRRVVRPGGRLVLRYGASAARCGFAPLFEIVDAEVKAKCVRCSFGWARAIARRARARRRDSSASLRTNRRGAPRITTTTTPAMRPSSGASRARVVAVRATTRARVGAAYLDAIAPWRVARRLSHSRRVRRRGREASDQAA